MMACSRVGTRHAIVSVSAATCMYSTASYSNKSTPNSFVASKFLPLRKVLIGKLMVFLHEEDNVQKADIHRNQKKAHSTHKLFIA